MKLQSAAALALALCLTAVPVGAEGVLNGSKGLTGGVKSSASASASTTPEVKAVGMYGEKYAVMSGIPVVLPPDGSEIPQPTIQKNKSGKAVCAYAIDRKKQYGENDQAVIKIIDSWNAAGAKETIEVKTKSGTKKVTGTFNTAAAKQVFMSVNEKRKAANLAALSWDPALADAAKLRAAELTVSNSHTRPDGTDFFTVAQGVTGENIAYGYESPAVAIKEWMNSPGHKANILRSTFDKLAVASFTSGGEIYWVQDFSGY